MVWDQTRFEAARRRHRDEDWADALASAWTRGFAWLLIAFALSVCFANISLPGDAPHREAVSGHDIGQR